VCVLLKKRLSFFIENWNNATILKKYCKDKTLQIIGTYNSPITSGSDIKIFM